MTSGVPAPRRLSVRPSPAPHLWLFFLLALSGCSNAREAEPEPAAGAGTYVVLADSSRVSFLFQRDGRAAGGTFPRVLGSLAFREDSRGRLEGEGRFSVDLATAELDDSTQTRALASRFFQVDLNREFRTAELRVRTLFGKRFNANLPLGGVTPISARGQLRVHGMAVSRRFEGEVARTPSGYRITTLVPILLSIGDLGLEDELAAWRGETGVASVADEVAVTVDLRLARRGPAPPIEQPSG